MGRYQLDRDANTQLIPFNRWRTWPYSHEPDAQIVYNPSIDVSFSPLKLYSHILIQSYIDIGLIYSSTDFFFLLLLVLSCSAESYSNPLAPEGHEVDDHRAAAQWVSLWQGVRICLPIPVCECIFINHACFPRSKLTNDDFRKLLMTPRAAPTSAPPSKSRHHEWVSHTPAAKLLWR